MTQQEFLFHLQGASLVSLKFAERYVKDKLTTDFKYNIIFTPPNIYGNVDQFDFYPEDEGIIKLNFWLKKRQFTSIIDFTRIKAKLNSWKKR
ncbi:hypothetical protein [Flavobacterium sp. SLB02]|uniref:hypothetical protein n=1 Tax=Flavobacterium sp. SLB02 TaxID=2665645 RepID=UPI0012A86D84|nr:hypothetical protein [Flavobacterium sp. SLB02]QGK73921.1 hypothetical protein GIY83_07570 [Flavobacterium sp. SLB02]